jgi:hypothetical protein
MRTIFTTTVAAMIAATLGLGALAKDDKKKEEPAKKAAGAAVKGDPTGKWTWSFSGPNGQSFEQTATLTVAGDKVTGTVAGRRGETPISDGTFKDGKLSFSVVRERDGRKMAAKFEGKVEGDAIKGTSTMNRGDGDRSMPWEAKRAK